MRKLLTKEMATLEELFIFYNPLAQERQLCFLFNPVRFTPYIAGGRTVTVNKLRGIAKAFYDDPTRFKASLQMPSCNLLDQPLTCCLISVDDVLVAIGMEEKDAFCHLVTGHVLDEETLFELYKDKKQKKMLTEINSLTQLLEKKTSEYEDFKKMTW